MKSIARTANQDDASQAARNIPPLPYPRRIRLAASLAWQTLRTGQHLPTVRYMQGTRDGIATGLEIASKALLERRKVAAR